MCAISDFSWPWFWLVCVFGKAGIFSKVSQIIGSLWLVYFVCLFVCFCYVLYKSDPYQYRFLLWRIDYWNRFLLERRKFITSLLISASGSFVTSLVSRNFALKHIIEFISSATPYK